MEGRESSERRNVGPLYRIRCGGCGGSYEQTLPVTGAPMPGGCGLCGCTDITREALGVKLTCASAPEAFAAMGDRKGWGPCSGEVGMLDRKGYVYCEAHGLQRRAHGTPCRKLRPLELQELKRGQPVRRY